MFLAYCEKIQKSEEKSVQQKITSFLKTVSTFCIAEFVIYPCSLFRTRACSYPRQKGQYPLALANKKVFFGYSIAFQKTFFTFYLRSLIFQIYSTNPRMISTKRFLSKRNEAGLIAGFFTGILLNLWNVALIKSKCTPFQTDLKNAKFWVVLKEIKQKNTTKSNFSLLKTGFFSFVLTQTLQGILEIQLFMKLNERYPEKTMRCLMGTSLVTTIFISPMEFMNIRYVLRKLKGLETPNFLRYCFLLAKKEGRTSFYHGAHLNFIRHFLFSFIIYKSLRSSYQINGKCN